MTAHPNPAEAMNRGLPKWPQMRVTGPAVTVDQAKEIIRRTDQFFMHPVGNNRPYLDLVIKHMGFTPGKYTGWQVWPDRPDGGWIEDFEAQQSWREQWGFVETSYVHNDWISNSYIGGPCGWCSPTGEIQFAENVGKWPSVAEVIGDWEKIASAFPFVRAGVTLMDREHGEDGAQCVVSFVVAGGEVMICDDGHDPHEGSAPLSVFDRDSEAFKKRFLEEHVRDGGREFENGICDEWIEEWAARSRMILAQVRAGFVGQK